MKKVRQLSSESFVITAVVNDDIKLDSRIKITLRFSIVNTCTPQTTALLHHEHTLRITGSPIVKSEIWTRVCQVLPTKQAMNEPTKSRHHNSFWQHVLHEVVS